MIEAPGIETKPVLDARGFVVLFDLWVAGQWIGSQRTVAQCEERLSFYCGVPIESYMPGAW